MCGELALFLTGLLGTLADAPFIVSINTPTEEQRVVALSLGMGPDGKLYDWKSLEVSDDSIVSWCEQHQRIGKECYIWLELEDRVKVTQLARKLRTISGIAQKRGRVILYLDRFSLKGLRLR